MYYRVENNFAVVYQIILPFLKELHQEDRKKNVFNQMFFTSLAFYVEIEIDEFANL